MRMRRIKDGQAEHVQLNRPAVPVREEIDEKVL